jgi:hypothetical protein
MKYFALIIIFALRLTFHPSNAQTSIDGFEFFTSKPATVVNFSGSVSKDKVMLNWAVDGTQTTELYEIEKSLDGKSFIIAALVFGSDKSTHDSDQFYDKEGNQKLIYHIKLVNKDKKTEYSPIPEIDPVV